MWRKIFCLAALSTALSASVWGAAMGPQIGPVSSSDFAHVYELAGEGEGGIEGSPCQLAIPALVYSGLVQSQTADLAVFNADGEIVPFAVTPGRPTPQGPPVHCDEAAPLFALPDSIGGTGEFRIRGQMDGRSIELNGIVPRGTAAERRYVLDLSGLSPSGAVRDARLILQLPEEGMPLNARADVLRSVDLRRWETAVKDAPLASPTIPLPDNMGRYLLLRVRGAGSGFVLRGARCAYDVWGRAREDAAAEFEGTLTGDRRAVEYDLGGAYPVTRFQFLLQEPGLHRARVASRRGPGASWRALGTAELFAVQERGGLRRNQSTGIRLREDRQWRVDFDEAISAPPPRLRIEWNTGTLRFLAQGRGPWTLAFGSGRRGLDLQSRGLLEELTEGLSSSVRRARLGASLSPDEAARTPEPPTDSDSPPWRGGLAWCGLALGAALLLFMAWRLL